MKKTALFILLLVGSVIASLSCAKQELTPSLSEEDAVVLTAAIEPGLKTSLDGTSVKWSAGDEVSVSSSGGSTKKFTLVSGAGTTSAQFSGTMTSTANPYYVIYPYGSSNSKGNDRLHFSVPQNQTYVENSFGAGSFPMYGRFDAFSDPVELKNAFGGIKLQFTGECTVSKITLEDLGGQMLWGNVHLVLKNSHWDLQTVELDGGSSSVSLICPDGVALDKTTPTAFYFAVPAGSFSSGLKATVYAGSTEVGSFSTSNDKTISRNNIRVLASKEVTGTGGGPTDLSAEESANCYILYDGGQYKFKAVKGNGSESLTVTGVDVVWETVNTATAPSVGTIVKNPSFADGYVTFTATGTPGNALIAAKNGSDIVWSWHIWVPSSKVTKAAYSNGKVAAVMDRNLGALVTTAGDPLSKGFIYQFGRKDPFMGSTSYSSNSAQAKATLAFTSEQTTASTTMDYVTAHPTTYFKYNDGVVANKDWLSGTDGSRYNWASATDASAKTIYDPCPPGYKVAPSNAWDGLTSAYSNYTWTVDGKHTYALTGSIYGSDAAMHAATSSGYIWSRNSGEKDGTFVKLSATEFTPGKISSRSSGYGVRCCSDTAPIEPPVEEPTVSGTVSCGGNPVQGVAVSDGVNVSVTDADGRYELISEKKRGYVFISVPSGYKVASETGGTTPQFFKYTTAAASVPETVDFEITAQSGQDNFKIIALGDIQVNKRCNGNDVEYFKNISAPDIQQYVNSHSGEVLYGLTLGDLAWNDFWYSKNFFLSDFKTMFNGSISGIQFYHTPGNHENDRGYNGNYPANELQSKAKFRSIIGPSYYSTNIGKWHIVILDNVCIDAISSPSSGSASLTYGYRISGEQLQWLQKDLENVASDTPLIVSMHSSLYKANGAFSLENGSALVAALGGRKAYFLTGHTHYICNVDKLSDNNTYEMNIGSVCGSVWDTQYYCDGLGVCSDGSAPGYKILDFSGKTLSWEYKCIGRDSDHQFRVYDRNQIQLTKEKYIPDCTDETLIGQWDTRTSAYSTSSSDNTIIINVYDYDPSWTVEVSEGGNPLAVEYLGSSASSSLKYDPLHLICMEAKYFNRNTKISCDSSKSSTHLFRCTASSANSTIVVKVTTRFGKVYQQTITRPYEFSIEAYK